LAVTGNDDVNIIAFITAAHMGVAQAIAETRCPETIVREKS
jgi:Trk K+ transport system NAD-binding subunit